MLRRLPLCVVTTKSHFLQIRVTAREKALLRRDAAAAGKDLSDYVLSSVLRPARLRFAELLALLAGDADHRFVLAELNDFLTATASADLVNAVDHADVAALTPFLRNYVAAMVEHACHTRRIEPPVWASMVAPLDTPWFATLLRSLRPHLLRASPVAFRRRNLFVDATLGARV